MAVLVTGGAGYIGSHMVLRLHDEGEQVVVIDDFSRGYFQNFPSGVDVIQADVRDHILLRSIFRKTQISCVFHFAALTDIGESMLRPAEYYETNTIATLRLAVAAAEAGVHSFVFSSTAAVYASSNGKKVAEEHPKEPVNPYGKSKYLAEKMLSDIARTSDMRLGVLRYFNVAGADPALRSGQSRPDSHSLFKSVFRAVQSAQPVFEIFGSDYPTADGSAVRDFIHVVDLVEAHILLRRYLSATDQPCAFNVGYGVGYSVRDIVCAVEKLVGVRIEVKVGDRRPGDLASVVADSRRIRKILNWVPRFDDIEKIVSDSWKWELSLRSKDS